MNGLLRRLTRRRAATADESPPGTPAASEPVDATVVSLEESTAASAEEQAREEELRRRRRDLPAGLDAEELEGGVGESARRGSLRRRVRYLRAAREVLLRDLGGFYYEVHRTAGTAPSAGHRGILETKAQRLSAIDEELRQLVARLGDAAPETTVVREPGVGGTCAVCGELHGSEAGWCSHCGTPLTERSRKRHERAVDEAIAAREVAAAEAESARAEQAAALPGTGETTAADATTADKEALAAYTAKTAPAADDDAAAQRPARKEADADGTGDQPTTELAAERDPVWERRA